MGRLVFLSILVLAACGAQAQNTFTLAQRARTPGQARSLLDRKLALTDSVINTLIAGVWIWPKANMDLLAKSSGNKISKKYVLMLADKYGTLDDHGKKTVEPFAYSDLARWAASWEEPDEEVLKAWLALTPEADLAPSRFRLKWRQAGGKDFTVKLKGEE